MINSNFCETTSKSHNWKTWLFELRKLQITRYFPFFLYWNLKIAVIGKRKKPTLVIIQIFFNSDFIQFNTQPITKFCNEAIQMILFKNRNKNHYLMGDFANSGENSSVWQMSDKWMIWQFVSTVWQRYDMVWLVWFMDGVRGLVLHI